MFIPDRQVRYNDVLNSHKLSLLSFYQDDGFGNCIDTLYYCQNMRDVSKFVLSFVNDKFEFVEHKYDF